MLPSNRSRFFWIKSIADTGQFREGIELTGDATNTATVAMANTVIHPRLTESMCVIRSDRLRNRFHTSLRIASENTGERIGALRITKKVTLRTAYRAK